MYINRSRGFTLIELLVVIAIIGVLSAVVLASLNTARNKGNDAAIQSDMATIQTQAEIYYGGAGANSYGPAQAWTAGTATGDPLAGGSVSCATGMFSDTTIKKALAAADLVNGTFEVGCAAVASGSLTGYVAAAQLTSGGWWCVDHTGVGKKETGAWPGATMPVDGGGSPACP
ncbi:MAG: type II secretion system protein [Patescibacteria group bacterium]